MRIGWDIKMMIYRVACWEREVSAWKWKSTRLNSLNAVLTFLRVYNILPKDRLRIFFASSAVMLDHMLKRENQNLCSNSMTANQFASGEKYVNKEEMRRLEAEVAIRENKTVVTNAYMPVPIGYMVKTPHAASFSASYPPMEGGPGGDHDTPYIFTPAETLPQAIVWIKLLAKVRRGELEP